jgi:hypothetical protein
VPTCEVLIRRMVFIVFNETLRTKTGLQVGSSTVALKSMYSSRGVFKGQKQISSLGMFILCVSLFID